VNQPFYRDGFIIKDKNVGLLWWGKRLSH
jgi:hypothetical protein